MRSRPRRLLRTLAAVFLLTMSACEGEHSISGRISDYESGKALEGAGITAHQSGWGISDGSLVWDKAYISETLSNSDGGFHLTYSHGSSANLLVRREGYQDYRGWYEDGSEIAIKLKRRLPAGTSLPARHLRLGRMQDDSFYGWNLAEGEIAARPEEADLFPLMMDADSRGPLRLGVSGEGGLLFRSAEELGVGNNFLIYADDAPAEGYLQELSLTFEGQGGLIFLRSRDGQHYAKIEFNPRAFSSHVAEDILRDLMLRYVYNPEASRALPFQE